MCSSIQACIFTVRSLIAAHFCFNRKNIIIGSIRMKFVNALREWCKAPPAPRNINNNSGFVITIWITIGGIL